MWSEWFNTGLPNVGDYIQVHAYEENVMTIRKFEGFVMEVDGWEVRIAPDAGDKWKAICWRRKIWGEETESTTEKELEEA